MIDSRDTDGHGADAGKHDRSSGMAPPQPDVLSQVLTLIRLRGELVYTALLGGAWAIAFPPGASHFLVVQQGSLWVRGDGAPPLQLDQGDLLLLPHGHGHVLGADLTTAPVAIDTLVERHFDRATATLAYGGAASQLPDCRLVGGVFQFEGGTLAPVMAALPALLHLRRASLEAAGWLAPITGFLVKEASGAEAGSALMVSRLIDLLVIRTLRTWAAGAGPHAGWLGGVAEERIGRALAAIHADPYRAWRVQDLAGVAAMSRSLFSERFTARVGEAPLQYVRRWKLTLAADMLAGGATRVTQAAQRTGYTSDAAFSRAFKAQFGRAPSQSPGD